MRKSFLYQDRLTIKKQNNLNDESDNEDSSLQTNAKSEKLIKKFLKLSQIHNDYENEDSSWLNQNSSSFDNSDSTTNTNKPEKPNLDSNRPFSSSSTSMSSIKSLKSLFEKDTKSDHDENNKKNFSFKKYTLSNGNHESEAPVETLLSSSKISDFEQSSEKHQLNDIEETLSESFPTEANKHDLQSNSISGVTLISDDDADYVPVVTFKLDDSEPKDENGNNSDKEEAKNENQENFENVSSEGKISVKETFLDRLKNIELRDKSHGKSVDYDSDLADDNRFLRKSVTFSDKRERLSSSSSSSSTSSSSPLSSSSSSSSSSDASLQLKQALSSWQTPTNANNEITDNFLNENRRDIIKIKEVSGVEIEILNKKSNTYKHNPLDKLPFTNQFCFKDSKNPLNILSSLNSLRSSKLMCDIVLQVDNEEFPCHKCVLAALSSYFLAMFSSELAESKQKKIFFNELDPETMRAIIEFAYTSNLNINESNVQSLLSAANLFDIVPVKEACCRYMEWQMEDQNCIGVYCFSDAHDCVELKDISFRYILKNFQKVEKFFFFFKLNIFKNRN